MDQVMQITINDVNLFFDVDGAAVRRTDTDLIEMPTMLLLHGGPGGDHSYFKPFFGRFTDIAQVIYVDFRGSGRSHRSIPEKWTLSQWTEDIVALCKVLKIDNPIVIGQSFGGFVAIRLAGLFPELPSKLILISTSIQFNLERKVAGFQARGGDEAAHVARQYWSGHSQAWSEAYQRVCRPLYAVAPPPSFSGRTIYNSAVEYHFNDGEYQTYDQRNITHYINVPTLVLRGAKDPNCSKADFEGLCSALKSPTSAEIPNAGHTPWRDNPLAIEAAIREFISNPE